MVKFSSAVTQILTAGLLMVLVGAVAAQQDYPNRPIRIIVPYPPGGSNDYLARLFSPKLTELLGAQVLVDNRGGGNTIVGNDAVAKSAPDGYTLVLAGSSHVFIPLLYRNIPYDAINDFTPIAGIARGELILVVHPSLPVTTARDLVALAKKNPGALNYAVSSTGGPTHLVAVQFEMVAGVKMQQVPYKGGGPAVTDLIGGHVQVGFATPATVVPIVRAGKLRGVAVTGEKRLETLPDVLTFTESGLPGVALRTWYVINAPAATPKAVIDKLASAVQKITTMPDVSAAMSKQGLDAFYSPPEKADAARREDSAVAAKLIKAANIKLTN
ncbi:MAG: Bug family tripartite tricarboxylate transporter substrate binding protein [Burkholderiales bacterium]